MAKLYPVLVLSLFLVAVESGATHITESKVDGNVFSARIELPAGIDAELTLRFEEVWGLSEEALGISARLASPVDPDLLSRLPQGALAIPAAFAVVVTVAPPPGGGLSFRGLAELGLYTHALEYAPDTPLRLFAAPPGGTFQDITARMSSGSYRTGGAMPDFAGEYIILSDLRAVLFKVDEQLAALEATLEAHQPAIQAEIVPILQQSLADVHSQIELGNLLEAGVEVVNFLLAVESYSGDEIPDRWLSWAGGSNAAGDLRAVASALSFALEQAQADFP